MEDTVVLKHHYIYMFRWDAKYTKETEDYMVKQFEHYNITNWIGKHEISENGKPHYQMAVWTENKFLEKEKTKVRNAFNRSKLRLESAQPTAFTDGRKIKSLTSYSTKDEGKKMIVQLPQHCLERIPKWKNKNAEKVQFQEKLRDYLGEMKDKLVGTDLAKIVELIIEFHIDSDRQPPSKGRMLYYLVKWEFISSKEYRREVYNFKMLFNYNDEYETMNHY